MKKKSIWLTDEFKKFNNTLTDFETDILIIGGGIAGVSTAFFLKNSKQKIMLIDSNKIGYGATAYSTAKITFLQDFIYQDIVKTHDFNTALLYLNSQREATKLIEKNVRKYHLDCDFKKCPSFILTNDFNKYKKESDFFNKCYIDYSNYPKYLNFKYCIGITESFVFHPIKYLYGLINNMNINIFENIVANHIEKLDKHYNIHTNQGIIKAKKIIITTHYPNFIKPLFIPFKTHFEKSYVVASKYINNNYNLISNDPFHSIRFHNDYILYGNNDHILTNNLNNSNNYLVIENNFKKIFNKNIDYIWFNQDVITNDYLPYIGKFDKNIYVATGFNTWGMTNGTIAGKIISDLIFNKKNEYEKIFQLKRSFSFSKFKNLMVDGFNISKIYLKTTLIKNHSFYCNVKISFINNKWIGIYTDSLGIEHKVLNKCPHMKCNLIFNNEEKTWDCPCHSSRFDIDGNVIRGPSKYSIKIE